MLHLQHSPIISPPPPPCLTGRGRGTGLLISNNWTFTPLPSLSINSSFESHSVTITYPLKIHFVVVYWPPGPLGNFVEELDVLRSNFPEDGTPLVILGDFNIHLEKSQAADFHTLLASFDLKRVLTLWGLRWFWGPWDVLTCPDICAYFSYL